MKPTIVLVHGAFAESASWSSVIDSLVDSGQPAIAAANPLRGVATDAAAVGDLVRPETSRAVPRSDGTTDLYIVRDRFQELFCADVPTPQATRIAATQRPATQDAADRRDRRRVPCAPGLGAQGYNRTDPRGRVGACAGLTHDKRGRSTMPVGEQVDWAGAPLKESSVNRSPRRRMP
jgi:hypothetical protein